MFKNKVAIVTGAATGLGEGIVEGLFARGSAVAVADIDLKKARLVAERLDAAGTRAMAIEVDVADPMSVQSMVAQVVDRFGGVHLAVNNAGITGDHGVSLADVSIEGWQKILSINLSGIFYGMKYEIPAMLAVGGGAIVNMSSGAGAVGQAGMAPYCATKHGIVGLTRTAALDYATRGIRINAIGPSYIDTPAMRKAPPAVLDEFKSRIPLGRLGTRKEVADTVAFPLSDEASFLTGGFYLADGGQTAR